MKRGRDPAGTWHRTLGAEMGGLGILGCWCQARGPHGKWGACGPPRSGTRAWEAAKEKAPPGDMTTEPRIGLGERPSRPPAAPPSASPTQTAHGRWSHLPHTGCFLHSGGRKRYSQEDYI